MLTLLKMSFLNIFRYRSRSVITVSAIAVSVFIAILVDALLMGIINQSTINLLNYEGAEVTVYAEGYLEKKDDLPSDIFIDSDARAEIEHALDSEGVSYTERFCGAAELVFYNEAEDFEGVLNAVLYGVDPQTDGRVFLNSSAVEEGRWPEPGTDGIAVGNIIAQKLGLEVGSWLTLETTGRGGFAETMDVQVVGIVNTEDATVNASEVYMSLDVLDEYLALDGAVTQFSISDGTPAVAGRAFEKKIGGALENIPGIEVWYYEEDNAGLMAVMNGDKGSSYLVLFFLFLIAAAGIANIMVMSVLERRRECAMLRAEGFSGVSITALFLLEGLLIGLMGAAAGCVIGVLVNVPLATVGIDLTPFVPEGGLDMGYRISMVVRSMWSVRTFAGIPLLAVGLTVLSSWLSVRRAGRGQIAELLRRA